MSWIQIRTNFHKTYWHEREVEQKLTNLSKLNKKKQWLGRHLDVRKSSCLTRILYKLVKRFRRLREFFYKVNPAKSRVLLLDLKRNIDSTHRLYNLFVDAVQNFNKIAPRHQVYGVQKREVPRPVPQPETEAGPEPQATDRVWGDCGIGLDPIEDGVQLDCGHQFERDNIINWLSTSKFEYSNGPPYRDTCPTCRAEPFEKFQRPDGKWDVRKKVMLRP